jgi:hypothetical protein
MLTSEALVEQVSRERRIYGGGTVLKAREERGMAPPKFALRKAIGFHNSDWG